MLKISSFYTCVPKTTIAMRYSFWDTEWDRFFCHFGSFFALIPPLKNPENQNFQKKMKKASGVIIILNLCNMIIWCTLTQMWIATDTIICHLRSFFALLPHYWPLKIKTWKNVKNTGRYYPFTHVYYKSRSYDV